jgi:hypothetical protein
MVTAAGYAVEQQAAYSQAFKDVAAHVEADDVWARVKGQVETHLRLLQKQAQVRVRNWLKKLSEEVRTPGNGPPPPPSGAPSLSQRCRLMFAPWPRCRRPPTWCGRRTATPMPGCSWSSCDAARWRSLSMHNRQMGHCPRCPSTWPTLSCRTALAAQAQLRALIQHPSSRRKLSGLHRSSRSSSNPYLRRSSSMHIWGEAGQASAEPSRIRTRQHSRLTQTGRQPRAAGQTAERSTCPALACSCAVLRGVVSTGGQGAARAALPAHLQAACCGCSKEAMACGVVPAVAAVLSCSLARLLPGCVAVQAPVE